MSITDLNPIFSIDSLTRRDSGKTRCTCGAKSSRTGKPCGMAPVSGGKRCKWHGGKSTGPRTEAGKAQARANGIKGGRPRKHPLPVGTLAPTPAPLPMVANDKVPARVQAGRCRDCRNLSAGYTCLPAARGELGPVAVIRPDMAASRQCHLFAAMVVADALA